MTEILTPERVVARLRIALFVGCASAIAAGLSWALGADIPLIRWLASIPLVASLRAFWHVYSDWGPYLFHAPFAVLLGYGIYRRKRLFRLVGLAYLQAQVLGAVLLADAIKVACGRPRPHVTAPPDVFCAGPSFAHAFHSFPSSHACLAAIGAAFIVTLSPSRAVGAFAALAALVMGFARMGLGEHYGSDVLAGFAIGIASAVAIAWLYLLPRWRKIDDAARP